MLVYIWFNFISFISFIFYHVHIPGFHCLSTLLLLVWSTFLWMYVPHCSCNSTSEITISHHIILQAEKPVGFANSINVQWADWLWLVIQGSETYLPNMWPNTEYSKTDGVFYVYYWFKEMNFTKKRVIPDEYLDRCNGCNGIFYFPWLVF